MPFTRQLQVVIGPNPPARLDKALSRDVPESEALSRTRLARLIGQGAVTRDGEVLSDPKARVDEGDVVAIAVEEQAEAGIEAEAIPLAVIYEDDDLIVIDKPAGMVVHPAPGARTGTLVNALLAHCGENLSGIGGERRPGIVHRIDKETSGLLVVAKTDRAHHGLAEQFAAHSIDRHYRAVVHGVPDASDPRLRGIPGVSFEPGGVLRVSARLDRHRHDRQRQAVTQSGGRHAITRAKVVEALGEPSGAALIDCWLETGRTHQIRVHMAHVGHGLIGDPTYGGSRRLSAKSFPPAALEAAHDFPRQALHAATLGFVHPVTGENVEFAAELPHDMAELITALRTIRTSA